MDYADIISEHFWRHWLNLVGVKGWALAKILVFVLAVRLLGFRLIDRMVKSITARQKEDAATGRVQTLASLIKSVLFYVLAFISGIMALRVFDVDPTPVLTAAGVVGLAVGFGAQRLVRDVISGFFIVLENQFSVGDYITVGAVTGTVEEMGMRVTKVRDEVGKLVMIANGDVTQVVNHSRGPIRATLDISVPASADLEKTRAVLDEIGRMVADKVPGVIKPPTVDGVVGVDASKVILRVAGEVAQGRQQDVQSALRELVREKLVAGEITLA